MLVVGLFGGAVYVVSMVSTTEVVTKTATSTVEVKVNVLEDRIQKAQDEAGVEIEAEAQAAYNSVFENGMRKVADQVKAEYIKEIEETITSADY